jgi:hypothetical protein
VSHETIKKIIEAIDEVLKCPYSGPCQGCKNSLQMIRDILNESHSGD